jgi:tripartite-type tricarboxylate transporter receptor subunit TctC
VVARISEELKAALAQAAVQEKFSAQGFGAQWMTPGQTGAFLKGEVEKWAKTVRESGAKVE